MISSATDIVRLTGYEFLGRYSTTRSTVGDHPVAGWLSPVFCCCIWLLGTCIVTGWALPTQYLSLSVCGLLYVACKNLQKLDYNGFGVLWYYRFTSPGSCRRRIFIILRIKKMLLLGGLCPPSTSLSKMFFLLFFNPLFKFLLFYHPMVLGGC